MANKYSLGFEDMEISKMHVIVNLNKFNYFGCLFKFRKVQLQVKVEVEV
jgi:hypothetical protein